jgi:hypothetical protein
LKGLSAIYLGLERAMAALLLFAFCEKCAVKNTRAKENKNFIYSSFWE